MQPWRRVDLPPERAVVSDVPACLPLAMLSSNDEGAHIPDRNVVDSGTVVSKLSILLELYQDRGGHTRPRIGNIRFAL